jgi:hypothetical protein
MSAAPASPGTPGHAMPPFTLGDTLSRTYSVWARNLLPFAVVSFVVHLPSLALSIALGRPDPTRPAAGFWVNTGLSLFLSLVSTGALMHGVLEHLKGRRASIGEMLRVGLARFGPVLAVAIAIYLALTIGLVLFVVPGIVVGCVLFVAIPVAVVERGVGLRGALGRSAALTKGNRFALFVVALLVWLTTVAIGMPAMILGVTSALPYPIFVLLGTAVNMLGASLLSVAPAVAYHDLRVSKEGVATDQLVAIFS